MAFLPEKAVKMNTDIKAYLFMVMRLILKRILGNEDISLEKVT